MSRDTFKLVTDYPVTEYRCGVQAGDQVCLKADLVIRDHRGQPMGVHPRGEIWTVLYGAAKEPAVVWLRQADGEMHTWSDDEFWQSFEVLPNPNV